MAETERTIVKHGEARGVIPEELLRPSLAELKAMAKEELLKVQEEADVDRIKRTAEELGMETRGKSFMTVDDVTELKGREEYGFLWCEAREILSHIGEFTPLGAVMVETAEVRERQVRRYRTGALFTPTGRCLVKIDLVGTQEPVQHERDRVVVLHLLDTKLAKHGLRLESGEMVNRVIPIPPGQQTL